MSDPLYDLLLPHIRRNIEKGDANSTKLTSASPSTLISSLNNIVDPNTSTKYLARLLSLHPTDLTTTEPQSLGQSTQSNHLQIQALSSRSHRTTTTSSDHLSTLKSSLPYLAHGVKEVRDAIPLLDESAVKFAQTYSKVLPRDATVSETRYDVRTSNATGGGVMSEENEILKSRKESMLLARQADSLQDILELPSLLSTTIAAAAAATSSTSSSTAAGTGGGNANYSSSLDLYAHIKRLSIVYPDSEIIKSVQAEAEEVMKEMTTNLINSLRSQNIRLAAAIRTIGWLKRVAPQLQSNHNSPATTSDFATYVPPTPTIETSTTANRNIEEEGTIALVFLTSRLHTFLTQTEALAPLRDLADQETERRLTLPSQSQTTTAVSSSNPTNLPRRSSYSSQSAPNTSTFQGHQTERYLKRYIEIFRENSFNTISMYRNIFPASTTAITTTTTHLTDETKTTNNEDNNPLQLPSALQSFPLHLVDIFFETLQTYLPNINDSTARESLLMQVLYAANSLGRLGADFSLMIATLDSDLSSPVTASNITQTAINERDERVAETDVGGIIGGSQQPRSPEEKNTTSQSIAVEPEWVRVIKKHRVQSARLDALAAGREEQQQQHVSARKSGGDGGAGTGAGVAVR